MSLYQKYRPSTLDGLYGNEPLKKSIEALCQRDFEDMPRAILFTGPSGCGKTTVARIIKDSVGCSDEDFKELNTADFRGVDTARAMIKQAYFRPINGQCTIWLLDECHKQTNDAQNAILKILEDPPNHALFILATTEPEKLLPTIKTRCATYTLEPLAEREIINLVIAVAKEEGKSIPRDVLKSISRDSLGSARQALTILEQIIDLEEEDMLDAAKRVAEERSQTIELCRALINKSPWKSIASILSKLESEPESTRRAILGYCNSILLKGNNPRAFLIMDAMSEPFFNTGRPGLTIACYTALYAE